MPENLNELKMAIIAGASHALKYKDKHWRATEEEVIKHVTENIDEILSKMDNPL